jgi:hypothetical protein
MEEGVDGVGVGITPVGTIIIDLVVAVVLEEAVILADMVPSVLAVVLAVMVPSVLVVVLAVLAAVVQEEAIIRQRT